MKIRYRLKKLLVLFLCVALVSGTAGIPVYAAKTPDAEEIIASGEERGLSWSITAGGVFTIAGSMKEGTSALMFPKWSEYADKVTSVVVTAENVTTTCYWFDQCINLTEVDFSGFDTSRVENMMNMFHDCKSLESLDLSSFDTSHVTNMQSMFSFCQNLKSLDVSSFDTSQVTDMSEMFRHCESLESLDVSGFDTSQVTNMDRMFSECRSLANLDVSKFNTGKVTDMSDMFGGCGKLTVLDVKSFDTSQVKKFVSMFAGIGVTTLDVSHFDTGQATTMDTMFARCTGLTGLDVSNLNTANVTDMGGMFIGCTGLTSLDLSNFDTSQTTDMSAMFRDCSSLTSLDLSNFDTSHVTEMGSMFQSCHALTDLNISSFDTSQVTAMDRMFSDNESLQSLDLGHFVTSQVTDVQYMFASKGFRTLDLENFDLSSVTTEKNGTGVFAFCSDLESLQTPKNVVVDISLYTDMYDSAGQVYHLLPKGAESIKLTKQNPIGGGNPGGEDEDGSHSGEDQGGSHSGDDQGGEGGNQGGEGGNQGEEGGDGGDKGDTEEGDNAVLTIKAIPDQIYTGAAIKPGVIVTCGKRKLVSGKDYTVSYKNNTNAALSSSAQAPCVTVKGKGNLSGSATIKFTVRPKKLADTDESDGLPRLGYGKVLSVAKNTKANPAIYYGAKKLTAGKDYDLSTNKGTVTAPGNITKDCKLYAIGKGNFEGALEIDVKAVDSKSLRKISVTQAKGFQAVYDGKEHILKFGSISGGANVEVTAKGVESKLQENRDYYVVYPANVTDAGTVKYTVVGMGEYTGSVTKSYKIAPIKASSEQFTVQFAGKGKKDAYAFNAAGVTVDQLTVTYQKRVLTAGKDYKVSYSGNKKTGTAKLNISFLGNFKGSKKITETFTIGKSALNDKTHEVKVAIPDKIYSGKANIYKSVPIVTVDGVKVKASNYKVSYYMDKTMSQSSLISGKNKVALEEGKDFAIVYVKIEGKGNYLAGDAYALTGSYRVCRKSDHVIDLSGAKVSFFDKNGTQITKLDYTGRAVEPYRTQVTCRVGQKDVILAEGQYSISCLNNVNKGKVTVLVTGTGLPGEGGVSFVGSRTASYSISAAPLTDTAR